jgi:predicted DNA-binding protein
MTPRTGRPTNAPKRNQYRIRLTDDELQMLDYCQAMSGKTKAEIIREGITKVYQELLNK